MPTPNAQDTAFLMFGTTRLDCKYSVKTCSVRQNNSNKSLKHVDWNSTMHVLRKGLVHNDQVTIRQAILAL